MLYKEKLVDYPLEMGEEKDIDKELAFENEVCYIILYFILYFLFILYNLIISKSTPKFHLKSTKIVKKS